MQLDNYRLVWEDDFDYEGRPDPAKWTYDVGNQWFNRELQAYTDRETNVCVKDGNLIIRAIIEKQGDKEYTSARIKTKGLAAWTYGYFEFRAILPKGIGSWPAIWLMPDSDRLTEEDKARLNLLPEDLCWPNCGEIDIMEHVGRRQNNVLFSVHCKNHNHANPDTVHYTTAAQFEEDLSADYHVYAMEWTEEYIEYFVDGVSYCRYNKADDIVEKMHDSWPFDKPYYLIMNVAVGGGLGGLVADDDLPFEMLVDYVRVYQKK